MYHDAVKGVLSSIDEQKRVYPKELHPRALASYNADYEYHPPQHVVNAMDRFQAESTERSTGMFAQRKKAYPKEKWHPTTYGTPISNQIPIPGSRSWSTTREQPR